MQDNEPINLTYGQMTDMVERIEQIPPLTGAGAPTTSTPAFHLGQRYINTTTGEAYCCTRLPASGATGYVWEKEASATDLDNKQDALTAGDNITIADESGDLVISATDTTYSDFTGTDGTAAGTHGLVPAPATTDAGKFLKADGTWDTAGGGGSTVVQTTGTSTTDVMSQNAVTSMIFADPATQKRVKIGASSSGSDGSVVIGPNAQGGGSSTADIVIGSNAYAYNGDQNIVIGVFAKTGSNGSHSIAIGASARADNGVRGAIALGPGAHATVSGVVDIGASLMVDRGYNSTVYRLLTGLYDGQSAHDAATYGQLSAAIINGGTTAPTTSTVGTVGTLYSYVDTSGQTPEPHLTVCTAVSGNTYTWTDLLSGIATALQTLNQGTGS